jgi:hypothetical protein
MPKKRDDDSKDAQHGPSTFAQRMKALSAEQDAIRREADGAGTKREGGRSKWLVLDEPLRERWQDSTGHRQLKKEWIAARSRKRDLRANQ